jgi:putative flippase GtrA
MQESAGARNRLRGRAGFQQLIKFCIVGASSTVIDKGSLWVLLNKVLPQAPWWVCSTISFCLAVSNGFFWNRHWTFRAQGGSHAPAREQYMKFVATNAVGLGLNLGITKLFLVILSGQILHTTTAPSPTQVLFASLCAVPIVVFWNFTAAKYWTFRGAKPDATAKAESISPNAAG